MPLNYLSSIPLYAQLRKIIQERINEGKYNNQIPSEKKIMNEFHVSRSTVRQAIDGLVHSGLLIKTPGRGTFVRRKPIQDWLGDLRSTNETIEETGKISGAKLIEMKKINLNGVLKDVIGLDEVIFFKRVRYANNIPIGIEKNYYPLHIGKKLQEYDLNTYAFYDLIEKEIGIPILEANQIIKAGNINKKDAELLETKNESSVLFAERKLVDYKGNFIEFEEAVYRSDMYEFKITLSRKN